MINMAKIALAFDVSEKASQPADSSVQAGYSYGFVFSPRPFEAEFIVRSPKHEEVILREYEAAKTVFIRYEN
jgi:hypothetical protein